MTCRRLCKTLSLYTFTPFSTLSPSFILFFFRRNGQPLLVILRLFGYSIPSPGHVQSMAGRGGGSCLGRWRIDVRPPHVFPSHLDRNKRRRKRGTTSQRAEWNNDDDECTPNRQTDEDQNIQVDVALSLNRPAWDETLSIHQENNNEIQFDDGRMDEFTYM